MSRDFRFERGENGVQEISQNCLMPLSLMLFETQK
jgi:hypothetical protein